MRKILYLVLLFFLFTLAGGVYGVIRSQINFTLCPEYYTKYQLILSATDSSLPGSGRESAGLIGFASAWWVGFFFALVILPLSLLHKELKRMVRWIALSVAMITLLTFSAGWIGFATGKLLPDLIYVYVPQNIDAKTNFTGVSVMNIFSLAGSFLGLCASLVSLYFERKRAR